MFNPKPQIFQTLNALGHYCAQGGQAQFAEVPAITFRIADNSTNLDLDNKITDQPIVAVVDVWADDSETVSEILGEVETAMRGIGYQLTYSADVPAPEGALHHVTTRFNAIK